MRINRAGWAAIAASALAGGVVLVVTNVAAADPAPDDPPAYVDVNAPSAVSSEHVAESGAVFTPQVRNTTEDPAGEVTVTFKTASPDDGATPSLRIVSEDERCAGDETISCTVDDLDAGTTEKFDLRLEVVDEESWRDHPVTTFAAEMSGGVEDTARDESYVYDSANGDSERVDVMMPDSISQQLTPETEGEAVRFEATNDTDNTLDAATLTVELEGLDGAEPSVIVGSDAEGCEATDTKVTCELGELAAGFSESRDITFWVGEHFDPNKGNYDTAVNASVTWDAGDEAAHTHATRTEYAHVDPYE